MDREQLFCLLTDQHQASLNQVVANQNDANQQMTHWEAQLMASQQPTHAPAAPAATREQLPLGVRHRRLPQTTTWRRS